MVFNGCGNGLLWKAVCLFFCVYLCGVMLRSVGDGALDVPLVSDFFNKLVSPAAIFFGAKSLRSLRGYIYIKG